MVGWNVAATQLVADRGHHKISDFVRFTSATVMSVNEYEMNMLNECWLKCMMFPLCMLNECICVCYAMAFGHVLP